MLKCHRSELLALSFGAVFAIAISPNAFAQSKKLSYEQAWAQCKSEVNRTVPGDRAWQEPQPAGPACISTVIASRKRNDRVRQSPGSALLRMRLIGHASDVVPDVRLLLLSQSGRYKRQGGMEAPPNRGVPGILE